jgi:acyl carrier protein
MVLAYSHCQLFKQFFPSNVTPVLRLMRKKPNQTYSLFMLQPTKGDFWGMDEPQIYKRLSQVFADVFDQDSIEVTPELSAKDVDGWDSLTHIRLILTIEKAFKVRFSTSEIGKLANVGDLVTLIKARA